MSYLVEKPDKSERVWTLSLEGYNDWSIVKQGAGAKPQNHSDFDGKAWVANGQRKTAVERKAKFRAMDREELVDFLLDAVRQRDRRLDALEARLAALEAKTG